MQAELHIKLIERSRKGDSKAQFELYSLFSRAMFNTCCRIMGAREDAEDMLQEAFVDIFRKLGTFRSESTFGTWAKRIVINRCINEIKRKKTVFEFFDDMQVFENQKDEDDSRYERKLTVSNVKNAMQFLPSGSRMIFSLYLIEGYDHVEISEILNISVSNSKSQYMRAKNKIKEILKNV